MTQVTKNYSTDGGDKLVIGGEIEILAGADMTGFPQGVAVADSTADAASVSAQLNALLASLRTAGIIAT